MDLMKVHALAARGGEQANGNREQAGTKCTVPDGMKHYFSPALIVLSGSGVDKYCKDRAKVHLQRGSDTVGNAIGCRLCQGDQRHRYDKTFGLP